MKFRTAEDVIRVAKERGFEICVNPGPPPMPFLKGRKIEATDALLGALKAWRLEIIDIVIRETGGI